MKKQSPYLLVSVLVPLCILVVARTLTLDDLGGCNGGVPFPMLYNADGKVGTVFVFMTISPE